MNSLQLQHLKRKTHGDKDVVESYAMGVISLAVWRKQEDNESLF